MQCIRFGWKWPLAQTFFIILSNVVRHAVVTVHSLDSLQISANDLTGDVGYLCSVLNENMGSGDGQIQADCGNAFSEVPITCSESCCAC